MLKQIKSVFGFLTIIPLGMDQDSLVNTADYMPIFPLVGAFIGLLAGCFAWALSHILPNTIVGVLTLGFLLLITGLHHTDGLLDLGDGLMFHGSAKRKIEIMHDQLTGAGGLTLGIITFLATALCIGEINTNMIIQSLIVVEVSAKLSMVMGAWAGKEVHKGMSTAFLDAMHGRNRIVRIAIALTISSVIALLLLGYVGLLVVLVAILTSLFMVGIAHRHFGGVTGDVLGATNELSRMVSLIALLALIPWV